MEKIEPVKKPHWEWNFDTVSFFGFGAIYVVCMTSMVYGVFQSNVGVVNTVALVSFIFYFNSARSIFPLSTDTPSTTWQTRTLSTCFLWVAFLLNLYLLFQLRFFIELTGEITGTLFLVISTLAIPESIRFAKPYLVATRGA
jgi:hypothetical protein